MGHSIFTLLCLGTEEISKHLDKDYLDNITVSGTNWHDLTDSFREQVEPHIIQFVHPEVVDDSVKVGSKNFYLILMLSWAKSWGYPVVKTAEELESLHLMLNGWKPSVTQPDFDIARLFDSDAYTYTKNFICSLDLTPNKHVDQIVKYLVKNNKLYYNKVRYLEQVAQDVLDNKQRKIRPLLKFQQALLMTMVYNKKKTPFKLVHNSFKTTQDIWDSMEIENG